ncbi:UvrD-helicase domain-containing protein [bacterium]|nr:UvrD-helicase domain-containing protein [bacterium]
MSINFEQSLNPQQLEAVTTTEGPVLVLAGAGSGKTRVLTYKIAYLIQEIGVFPGSILAVTFTNKAAGEMRQRAEKLIYSDASNYDKSLKGIWMGTFHSLCGRILRDQINLLGYTSNFTIYDEKDSLSVVKNVFKEMDLDPKLASPKSILYHISNLKNDLIYPEGYKQKVKSPFDKIISEVYSSYQNILRKNNAVDFDDMLMFVVQLFQNYPEVKTRYAEMFSYLLVDEFQDTNSAQYEFLRHLASAWQNLTVVGDDDQSIYSWRGANLGNILYFTEDFPSAKTIRLEQNYRSTQNILDAAGAVVENNRERHPKKLWTEAERGEPLTVLKLTDDRLEGETIGSTIEELIREKGYKGGQIAVLYRTNAQSRLIEEALRKRNIQYTVIGGVKFFERAEIKDVLAYLSLIANPQDDLALKRIINIPPRGLGKVSLERIETGARKSKMSILDYIIHSGLEGLTPRAHNAARDFGALINDLQEYARNRSVDEVVDMLLDGSGYLKMLQESEDIKSESRLDNIGEFVADAHSFTRENHENASLQAYLQQVSLITDIDTWQEREELVNLMTAHAAKGLEFDVVFAAGMEEGLFPLMRAQDENHDIEEERRLFYVVLTRAKKKAYISWAAIRHRFTEEFNNLVSRFIKEIPSELTQRKEAKAEDVANRGFSFTFGGRLPVKPDSVVYHPNFGRGVVRAVQGLGDNITLTISFYSVGIKKIMLKYANLEIVQY